MRGSRKVWPSASGLPYWLSWKLAVKRVEEYSKYFDTCCQRRLHDSSPADLCALESGIWPAWDPLQRMRLQWPRCTGNCIRGAASRHICQKLSYRWQTARRTRMQCNGVVEPKKHSPRTCEKTSVVLGQGISKGTKTDERWEILTLRITPLFSRFRRYVYHEGGVGQWYSSSQNHFSFSLYKV